MSQGFKWTAHADIMSGESTHIPSLFNLEAPEWQTGNWTTYDLPRKVHFLSVWIKFYLNRTAEFLLSNTLIGRTD